ncbi:hypothetical protein [Mycolicibacterium mucogenicum]|uniref:hypothetical protein n=1 Tax=Mycolicibacterium mucogenicum TaxID=56689 RepID=UPI000A902040|nr:hypothetical protein [Mycolicibacterium mucogenicum]
MIQQMFQASKGVGAADHKLGESLDSAGKRTNWHGEAGEAFQAEIGKQRTDLDRDGVESKGVAAALQQAEKGVEYCRNKMNDIYERASQYGWTITSDWRVDDSHDTERKHDPQLLQNDLDMLKTRAHAVDHELATAMRAAVGDAQVDDQGHQTGGPPPVSTQKLTPEEQAQVAQWSQMSAPGKSGVGDCSRWATASALANKFGTRQGPDGKEINLPPDVQRNLMGGMPLHFPPNKTEINQIAHTQGVAAGSETQGFPGGPALMTKQLNDVGLKSTEHSGAPSALVDQMTSDLKAGHMAIVNGAFPTSDGHFISVTGVKTGPNGETLYLVNDSNRAADGTAGAHTLPPLSTRSQLEAFLRERANYGTPGYSTVE